MKHLLFTAGMLVGGWLMAAHATQPVARDWSIGEDAQSFVWVPEKAWLSEACASTKKCQAYSALQDKVKLEASMLNGRNPASAVCKEKWKAKVVIARHGDETQGFCVFADDSVASLGGLLK